MHFRTVVQIYEIQNPEEAEAVVALGVDHVGSVIVSETDWKIAEIRETVKKVRACGAVSSLIPLISDTEAVMRILDYYEPDIVHFCDNLQGMDQTPGRASRLMGMQEAVRNRYPDMKIMRSIPIAQNGSYYPVATLEYARRFEPVSDMFLTDTLLMSPADNDDDANQPVPGYIGITGKICDWRMASRLVEHSRIPTVLAGGITPENAANGLWQVSPWGIDSCTGTNAVDRSTGKPIRFKKDLEKVRRLVSAVREADARKGAEDD